MLFAARRAQLAQRMHLPTDMGIRPDFEDPQTYKIIGAAMTVHRVLGCGFLEAVSREALAIELEDQGIPFVREARLPVSYRNRALPVFYTVDFICYGEILVELKALAAIGSIEVAQLITIFASLVAIAAFSSISARRVFSTNGLSSISPTIPFAGDLDVQRRGEAARPLRGRRRTSSGSIRVIRVIR